MAGEDGDAGALEPLLRRIAERLDAPRAELVAGLARAAFRRRPVPAEQDLDATVDLLDQALAFLDGREAGTLGLRVTNPPQSTTVVDVNVEDSPFLLSTLHEELASQGLEPVEVVHPIIGVERGPTGRIVALGAARGAARRESWIHIEANRRVDDRDLGRLEGSLRSVLADALAATRDEAAMRDAVEEAAFATRASAGARYAPDEVDEVIAFLDWLVDDHFILLGAREYDLVDTPEGRAVVVGAGSGLGILRDEAGSRYAEPVALAAMAPSLRARVEGGDLLLVSRTNRVSTVHSREHMVYIGVKKVNGAGDIDGEYRFLGLFSQKAFAEASSSLPVLRRKLRLILEREDIVEHSHEERALRSLFEALPKQELFAADVDDLHASLVELLAAQDRQAVRLLCRADRRSASVAVNLPRDRFSARIRKRIQALLEREFRTTSVDYHLSITESDQALLHFLLHTDGPPPQVAIDALERRVLELTRSWEDELGGALERAHGRVEGRRLAAAYAGVFPPGYTDLIAPVDAVADIAELEQLDEVRVALRPARPGSETPLRFLLYKRGEGVELSSFLPILESLGLTVVEEVPHRLAIPTGEVMLHDFGVRPAVGASVDATRDGPRLAAAARAVWDGRAEADSLNRLVLAAGLDWDDVAVLRAYRRYRRQVGTAFTEAYQAEALVGHPDVARGLVDLFAARFDPALQDRDDLVEDARTRVLAGCDAVERLDADRILRGYLGLVESTLRTNRYRPDRVCLALKLDSTRVPDMPKPVPHVEVFVYSPAMEAVHLRGGPVARGGIRWSDRQEDVRTEVLGLLKAQMVKNALIVPTGAKGGFVLKRPPPEAGALRPEVHRLYDFFVRGLLDLTDNIVDGECVAPSHVRRHDGDDPYLVVAPDRGTATFSDTANAVSAEYGFWLRDAFASGGSTGYDHKAMGITARGAWCAVRRHFRELDVDVHSEPTTVVGIGDMSGDVFGNGLLQSRAVRLVGAFDHRHVFLDPDPDPRGSYEERLRLFRLAGSSWADYDRSVISAGGGVWSRADKSVPLSAQVRALLGVEETALPPPELIRRLLSAPVDLLFAAGVGTFVKSSRESHADVGDRANDAVRVDATVLGARVVGEGANLALTQRARVEYARRGGRCNTDAIDNAGGVATSDREVNLKILLGAAVADNRLSHGQRDSLLAATADDVASAVLDDVDQQTRAISREVAGSHDAMAAYEHLMVELEAADGRPPTAARLDRGVETLPTTADMQRRRRTGAGLVRPEVAVLLSYAKIDLAGRLLGSRLPEERALAGALAGYFPDKVRDAFGDLVGRHRLRRELVSTVLANEVVDRMGSTYVSRTHHELGCSAAEIAAAYWAARQVTGADEHWRTIDTLDEHGTPALPQELAGAVGALVDACVRRYLRPGTPIDLDAVITRDRAAFVELTATLDGLGPPRLRAARRGRVERYTDLGVDPALAERVVTATELAFVPDVAEVARDSGRRVADVAEAFLALSDLLPLDVLLTSVNDLAVEGHWERWQVRGLRDELRDLRRQAAHRALREQTTAGGADAVAAFLGARRTARARVEDLVARFQREPEAGLHGAAVVVRALRDLLT